MSISLIVKNMEIILFCILEILLISQISLKTILSLIPFHLAMTEMEAKIVFIIMCLARDGQRRLKSFLIKSLFQTKLT